MSDCLVWRSSVPHRHKQFSRTRSAITEYKGYLQLKRSTTERHIKTTLLCPTYSLKAAKLIHGDDNDIDAARDRNPPYLARILWLRPLQLVTCVLRCGYVKIKFPCLNRPEYFFPPLCLPFHFPFPSSNTSLIDNSSNILK